MASSLKPGESLSDAVARAQAAQLEAVLTDWKAKAEDQAKAIEAQQAATQDGNAVARGFNSFVNLFNGNADRFDSTTSQAVAFYRTELPQKLDRFHGMVTSAKTDAEIQAAQQFLQETLNEAADHGRQFDRHRADLQATNKFWSGLAADVGSGLLVLGGAAIAVTGFGAPIGAGMIATGFAAGGALSVGGHALLDNQYAIEKEALGNFLIGGVSAASTIFTAGAGTALTATTGRMLATQSTTAGITNFAGEASAGFQDGWTTRVVVGTGVGTALGAGATGIAGRVLPRNAPNTLARGAVNATVGASSGAVNATGGAFIGEMSTGFQEGWRDRLAMQALGGAVLGTAFAFSPNLYARNEALSAAH